MLNLPSIQLYLDYCAQSRAPQCKRNWDIMETLQWSSNKMIKGLEYPSYEDRLRELGLFSLEEEAQGGSYLCL